MRARAPQRVRRDLHSICAAPAEQLHRRFLVAFLNCPGSAVEFLQRWARVDLLPASVSLGDDPAEPGGRYPRCLSVIDGRGWYIGLLLSDAGPRGPQVRTLPTP